LTEKASGLQKHGTFNYQKDIKVGKRQLKTPKDRQKMAFGVLRLTKDRQVGQNKEKNVSI